MGELQELIAKKKEIERRIRAIKYQTIVSGKARLFLCTYTSGRESEWRVSIDTENIGKDLHYGLRLNSRSVLCGRNRQDVIDRIQPLIDDLVGLKLKLEEAEYEESE